MKLRALTSSTSTGLPQISAPFSTMPQSVPTTRAELKVANDLIPRMFMQGMSVADIAHYFALTEKRVLRVIRQRLVVLETQHAQVLTHAASMHLYTQYMNDTASSRELAATFRFKNSQAMRAFLFRFAKKHNLPLHARRGGPGSST